MNKDELMQMARDAQVIGSDDSLECFANAILERAAAECNSYADRDSIRSLKIKEGE